MIELTPRDLKIVTFLRDQGFASFEDIRIRFFEKKSVTSRRLRILCEGGVLESKSINEIFGIDPQKQFFPYLVQLKMTNKHRIYRLGPRMLGSLSFGKTMQRKDMLFHQIFLNQVRLFIEKVFPEASIMTEQMIQTIAHQQPGRKREIAPDMTAEFIFKDRSIRMAIELERTIKDRKRYLQKSDHLDRSWYTHVWYVGLTDKSLKTLSKKLLAHKKYGFSHIAHLHEVLSPDYGKLKIEDWIQKAISSQEQGLKDGGGLRAELFKLKRGEDVQK